MQSERNIPKEYFITFPYSFVAVDDVYDCMCASQTDEGSETFSQGVHCAHRQLTDRSEYFWMEISVETIWPRSVKLTLKSRKLLKFPILSRTLFDTFQADWTITFNSNGKWCLRRIMNIRSKCVTLEIKWVNYQYDTLYVFIYKREFVCLMISLSLTFPHGAPWITVYFCFRRFFSPYFFLPHLMEARA